MFINIDQYLSMLINIYQCLSIFFNIYQCFSIFINIYQYLSMFINILTKFLSAWSKHQSQNSRIDRIDRKVVRADPFVRQAQELQELRRFGGSEEVEKKQTPEKSKKFKTTLVFENIKNLALPLSKESSRVIKQILYRLCPRTFQCLSG